MRVTSETTVTVELSSEEARILHHILTDYMKTKPLTLAGRLASELKLAGFYSTEPTEVVCTSN